MTQHQVFSFVVHTILVQSLMIWVGFAHAAADETYDLHVTQQKNVHYRIQSQYQHSGSVIVRHAGKDEVDQNLKIDVRARLDYHDRSLSSSKNLQSVRYFNKSIAAIKVDGGSTKSTLADSNQLVVVRVQPEEGNQFQIASIAGMLEQHEMDLLKNPADPLTLSALFESQPVAVDGQWTPDHDSLARFLAIDRVHHSEVNMKLKSVDNDLAKVYMVGQVKGDVDDVQTSMTVAAIFQVDLNSHLVSAVRLNITENREPGQVAPGFEGQTKVDLQIAKDSNIDQLSDESLKKVVGSGTIRALLKWVADSGSFSLQYEPSWKMIGSADEAAILRYLEKGDLLAQCNIVRLASRPANKPLLLEEFKAEVTKVIAADETAHVVGASETRTRNGLKALQVSVRGVEEEVPLNWFYYNVASADGRQVTFVFTLEEEVAGRVETVARKMVDGFAFHALPEKSRLEQRTKAKQDALSKPTARDAKIPPSATTR